MHIKPGRYLDKKVLIEVMKKGSRFICPRCLGSMFGSGPEGDKRYCHDEFNLGCRWSGPFEEAAPPFSSNMQHAWDVRNAIPMLFFCGQTSEGRYWVKFTHNRAIPRRISGESLPHAICLAALDWVKRNE